MNPLVMLDPEVEGRLLALAALDIRPDQLGHMLVAGGLDRTWAYFTGADSHGEKPFNFGYERLAELRRVLRPARPAALSKEHQALGLTVFGLGLPGYPDRLSAVPHPSGVLIVQGDPSALSSAKTVAIVGTRRASSYGRQVARNLGADLTEAGVSVVSGLARGIDGAAHEGATTQFKTSEERGVTRLFGLGAPIGVIAHGHDHVYPSTNRNLFGDVAKCGALVSERPIGIRPLAHYFPQRNTVVVGLADVVIVVESSGRGGSMISAEIALRNSTELMAVPGSIFSDASSGCHRLIADGASVCSSAHDVLEALAGIEPANRGRSKNRPDTRPTPSPEGSVILRLLGWDVVGMEALLARCEGNTPGKLLLALHELEFDGWVARGSNGWFQRAAGS